MTWLFKFVLLILWFWIILSFADDGFKRIRFHIKRSIHEFTKEKISMIVTVVAEIMDCAPGKILLSGILPSTSFFLVFSVHELERTFRLHNVNEQNRLRFAHFDIDYFIVDEKNIKIKSLRGEYCLSYWYFFL